MTSMTIHVSDEELERVRALAARSGRSIDYVIRQVVVGGLSVQEDAEALVEGIERGLADVEHGRVVPASDVSKRLDALLTTLQRK